MSKLLSLAACALFFANTLGATFLHQALRSRDPFKIMLVRVYLELNPDDANALDNTGKTLGEVAREIGDQDLGSFLDGLRYDSVPSKATLSTDDSQLHPVFPRDIFTHMLRTCESHRLKTDISLRLVCKQFRETIYHTLRERGEYEIESESDLIRFILQANSPHYQYIRHLNFCFNFSESPLFFATFLTGFESFLKSNGNCLSCLSTLKFCGVNNVWLAQIMMRVLTAVTNSKSHFLNLHSIDINSDESVPVYGADTFFTQLQNKNLKELSIRGRMTSCIKNREALLQSLHCGFLGQTRSLHLKSIYMCQNQFQSFATAVKNGCLENLEDFYIETGHAIFPRLPSALKLVTAALATYCAKLAHLKLSRSHDLSEVLSLLTNGGFPSLKVLDARSSRYKGHNLSELVNQVCEHSTVKLILPIGFELDKEDL